MLEIHPTPNPNSVKVVTSRPLVASGTLVVTKPEDAKTHAVAAALLAIDGVRDLFFTPMFVTVSKRDGASWDQVLPKVEEVLRPHLS